jgi:hypothetical protein
MNKGSCSVCSLLYTVPLQPNLLVKASWVGRDETHRRQNKRFKRRVIKNQTEKSDKNLNTKMMNKKEKK